ncbi:MAG: response regulator [Terriglobales bacterium]
MCENSIYTRGMCGGQPHCLLVIDDSPDIRRAVRRLFETREGWQACYEAIDGRDGIEKAKEHRPCAIILDMSMPQMDGLETAQELRVLMPATPLFMFTNFSDDQFLTQEVMKVGIRKVVSKSDASGLVAAIESILAA